MAPDAEALRAILKQYIGPSYDRALRNTGDPEAAKEATRRAMELLKRACLDGVEPTKALALRITDDCCNEKAFFNRQLEMERQKLQAMEGTPPQPAPNEAMAPASSAAMATAQPACKKAPAKKREPMPKVRTSTREPEVPDFVLTPAQRKSERQDQASAGTVLLVMFLSLVIVLSVICLVLALAGSGVLPDASGVLDGMATWFNTHIFPMF